MECTLPYNNNIYLLQFGCHTVAVVILHVLLDLNFFPPTELYLGCHVHQNTQILFPDTKLIDWSLNGQQRFCPAKS